MDVCETVKKLEEYISAYKSCNDEKKKRILHIKIVEEAMPMVKKIAGIVSRQSGISSEDLLQVGSIGLIKAIDLYKDNYNTKFKTYATYFIKGEIQHYLRDKVCIIKMPRELQELVGKISDAIYKLNEKGIDEPTASDIANYTGIDENKIEDVLNIDKYKTAISLDQYFKNDDENTSLIDKIPSGDYDEIIDSYETKIMLLETVKKLPDDLKKIVELSFFKDLTHREIADKLNISQMQVSRKLKKALNKMYEMIGGV